MQEQATGLAGGHDFLDAFVPSKPVKGLTNKTIKHHHRLISSILNQAVYWQVIPSNPAERVKPPKVERTEAKYLDEIQTAKLLELLEKEEIHHRTMIKLFLYSGFRRGELCCKKRQVGMIRSSRPEENQLQPGWICRRYRQAHAACPSPDSPLQSYR